GALQSAVNGTTVSPSSVMCCVNVTVAPGATFGLSTNPPRLPVRSAGSETRHVVCPTLEPWLVTDRVTARPVPSGTAVAVAVNGPIPEMANRPATARMTMNATMPAMAIPWTCELAESRRPSGLQRSHRPTSMGTGAPQRTQAWVGAVRAGGADGAAAGGWTVPGAVTSWWCHETTRRATARDRSEALPAAGGPDERGDVGSRPGQHDHAIGAGLV